MSDITLPRAAEQVRKALELALESQFAPDDVECEHGMHYRDCSNNVCVMRDCKTALDALDAALAEPDATPEPVAWMYVNLEGECEQIEYGTPSIDDDSITLLYAAPPEPDAKREPATMQQIVATHHTTYGAPWLDQFDRAWKAAERFHGIGGSK